MFAQPSQSAESRTYYRESDESDRGQVDDRAPKVGSDDEPSPHQQLLQEVLGETLIRNQENPEQLIESLHRFREEHATKPCDETIFTELVRAVLRHRLGQRVQKLPADLFEEVGQALWSNEHSRQRVQRLWQSLGAES